MYVNSQASCNFVLALLRVRIVRQARPSLGGRGMVVELETVPFLYFALRPWLLRMMSHAIYGDVRIVVLVTPMRQLLRWAVDLSAASGEGWDASGQSSSAIKLHPVKFGNLNFGY
jgi:hypothetical protein